MCVVWCGVVCHTQGTSDLTNDLHALHTLDRTPLIYSLSKCVVAARAFKLRVIDGVFLSLNDPEVRGRASNTAHWMMGSLPHLWAACMPGPACLRVWACRAWSRCVRRAGPWASTARASSTPGR